jgi:hypothetical protein
MRKQLQIGTKINCRFGEAKITAIELCEQAGEKEGIPMKKVWIDLKDRCVFTLDNGHWQYGYQVEAV